MRFLANGPDLPSDLLDARDEGQVIFFCGAGVSRAEAGGPSFAELADRVVTALGSSPLSPARQLIALSKTIDPVPGVGGIPSADRIFALLEQEFPIPDVRRAVAAALRPKDDAGLDPHKSLIDLSRAPDGTVRLVTTNFDRVFELADPTLEPVVPPLLPDPSRTGSLKGIIHLHGKVSTDYLDAEGPEFVLSSADFGRAYLADGWATSFMRALLDRYRIVFVGYSADDPPMQYLLEALKPALAPGRLYALQDGEASSASGLWRHKGVTALPFTGFDTLWGTLAKWAKRARDPDGWRRAIARMATEGPRGLEPFQRGQVAHLVSSPLGARVFADQDLPPPAEWLCAFDPYVRYDRPRPLDWRDPEDRFDPFDSYGFDGEIPPARGETRDGPTEAPAGSWSAFELQPDERLTTAPGPASSFRGPGAEIVSSLSPRQWQLARWIGRVASDPTAIWWAAGQNALHPNIVREVNWAIQKEDAPVAIRRAWRLLLTALAEPKEEARDRYELEAEIKAEGWSRIALIKLGRVERPRLIARRPATAPINEIPSALRYVEMDVTYPGSNSNNPVPAEYLSDYVFATHSNLLQGIRLEEEIGGFALSNLSPINPYECGPTEFVGDIPSISTLMAQLALLVLRLGADLPELAKAEVASWRGETGLPFRNLRVWAAGQPSLTSVRQASDVILMLGEDAWEDRLERDLLISLNERWPEFDEASRDRIEAIMLAGPAPWPGVDPSQFEQYRIHAVLRRLYWMQRERIAVSFDLGATIESHKAVARDWDERDAADRLDRSPSRGGWVATDKTHSALRGVPLDQLLTKAQEASGRGRDFLVQARPFAGLVETRSVRAFAALRRAAERLEPWEQSWNDYFWSEARGSDKTRLRSYLANRICRLPTEILVANLRPIVNWFTTHGRPIWDEDRSLHLRTWCFLIEAVAANPDAASSTLVTKGEHDWVTEAFNSPAGRLADLLFNEVAWSDPPSGVDAIFKKRVGQLLTLNDEPQAHAAVMIGMRLNWLYNQDSAWTIERILSLLRGDPWDPVADAALTGLLRQGHFPPEPVFLELRSLLVGHFVLERRVTSRRNNLAEIVLAGWYRGNDGGERLLSSSDLREALILTGEQQRLAVLQLVGQWAEEDETCAAQTVRFIEKVWPRQLAARSPAASAGLARIALRAGDLMPQVTASVLPLIEATPEPVEVLRFYRSEKDETLARFPEDHLAIFHAMLPVDASIWPWGIAKIVEKLADIDTLRGDPRLSELRRRLARL